jgi:uncharacterized membrane protein
MPTLPPHDRNALDALMGLLAAARIRATRRTVAQRLFDHPDFPGLAALSDVLTDLNVEHLATRLTPDALAEIPLPALVQLREGNDVAFATVRSVTSQTVEWQDTTKGWQRDTRPDFEKRWTGIALLIEPTEQSGERDYDANRRRELVANSRVPLMVLGTLFCFGLLLWHVWPLLTVPLLGLLGLKTAGAIVSGLLVAYSLDSNNPALKKLCTIGKSGSCQSVLETPAAKLWSDFNWADVGLLYFASGFAALVGMLLTQQVGIVQWLLWANVLALPYTLWSVYYQAVAVRQYCILCLMVQATLWAEFVIGVGLWQSGTLDANMLWHVIGTFVGVTVLWTFIRQPLSVAQQLYPTHRQLQRVKFSEAYVHDVFTNRPQMQPYLNGQKVLILGNPDGEHTLTMISHPECNGCRINHLALNTLLQEIHNLRVEIVLIASTVSTDRAGQVAQVLLGLPDNQVEQGLHRWFVNPHQPLNRWISADNLNSTTIQTRQWLRLNEQWAIIQCGIRYTPISYLNGVQMSSVYSLSDIPLICKMWRGELQRL